MKFMKKMSNKDKKIFTIGGMVLLLVLISGFLLFKSHGSNIVLDEVRLKNSDNSSMFAIWINDGDGIYRESEDYEWPTGRYKFNAEKSGCMDGNGKKTDGELKYYENNNTVSLKTKNASLCYLYFDKKTLTGKELAEEVKGSDGLSEDILGDMHRYQGSKVNNYICINSDKSKCVSGDDDMYRIIGITEAGEIKVIKQTALTTAYAWNNCSSETSGTGNKYCNATVPEWPNSTLFNTLNTEFLNSISDIANKIEERNWYYGDIYDYQNITSKEMYKIETGLAPAHYYAKGQNQTGLAIQEGNWEQTSNPAKIGLMYLHDYSWASTATNDGHETSCNSGDFESCRSSWIHLSQNDLNAPMKVEWTMTRWGRNDSTSNSFVAWSIYNRGLLSIEDLHIANSVRPVFYLKSGVEIISGTGQVGDPYITGDYKPNDAQKIIDSKKGTDGLSKGVLGDMYRYQGTNAEVKNYICIKADGSECKSGDDDMYRIIGITPDGQIKVIKQKALTTAYAWNTCEYEVDCKVKISEWPESTIFNTLNTTFLSSLNGISDKILERNWYYGDLWYDYANINSVAMYALHTGVTLSHYYAEGYNQLALGLQEGYWKKTSGTSKIGLMYLYDYGWAVGGLEGHATSCTSNYGDCLASWIHLTKNDTNAPATQEWTMSRIGRFGSNESHFYAWYVHSNGWAFNDNLDYKKSVRPVFYLRSGITIKSGGDGSEGKPYVVG